MSRHLCRYRVTDDSLLHPMKYYIEKVLTKSECKPLCVKRTAFIPFSILCLRNLTARLTRLEQSSLPQICDDLVEKKKYPRKKKGVIVKVKTTFEGTKTLLVASTTERKYNWKGVTCYFLFLLKIKHGKKFPKVFVFFLFIVVYFVQTQNYSNFYC